MDKQKRGVGSLRDIPVIRVFEQDTEASIPIPSATYFVPSRPVWSGHIVYTVVRTTR